MKDAIKKRGFSFIEIMSQCPENYGRKVGLKTGKDFLHMFKKQSVRIEKIKKMSEEKLKDKIVIGKLCDDERPEYVAELHKLTNEQVELLKQEETN